MEHNKNCVIAFKSKMGPNVFSVFQVYFWAAKDYQFVFFLNCSKYETPKSLTIPINNTYIAATNYTIRSIYST